MLTLITVIILSQRQQYCAEQVWQCLWQSTQTTPLHDKQLEAMSGKAEKQNTSKNHKLTYLKQHNYIQCIRYLYCFKRVHCFPCLSIRNILCLSMISTCGYSFNLLLMMYVHQSIQYITQVPTYQISWKRHAVNQLQYLVVNIAHVHTHSTRIFHK